jgi:hypothetical protein
MMFLHALGALEPHHGRHQHSHRVLPHRPAPGPYFTKMVISGHGFRTLTYVYKVLRGGGTVIGGWL